VGGHVHHQRVRAIIVNSGNANACTGPEGVEAVRRTAAGVAAHLGCTTDEVLVASTGPIGVPLPIERVERAIPSVVTDLRDDPGPFARAIMTTDTRMKIASEALAGGTVVGVCKGAAMVAPRMATMLAFITSDVTVEGDLGRVLGDAVDRSFNRLSIDACESTNDSVFLLSSGLAGTAPESDFANAVQRVCLSLAEQIARDPEGGTKLVRIEVDGARSEDHAVSLGRGVAASSLWRAAAHGADPNWGRILSALGSVDRELDLARTEITIGPAVVFSNGAPSGDMDVAAKAMTEDEFVVRCQVGDGDGRAEILSADLSPEYVRLNAEGAT
jgi:glutamate N-acetyltransferase / amino-acid N-acetyltransferase